MGKHDRIDKSKKIYRIKKTDYKNAKIETYNIKILEAEKDFEACKTFLNYGHEKEDNKLVETYLQDYTDSIKIPCLKAISPRRFSNFCRDLAF